MLRSFDGLALRQLRTRRLRALLTAFGVVLGVGMVYGVLLMAGTIRATFDDLITSAYGGRDLVVNPKAGMLPDATLENVRANGAVARAGGMIGAVFSRLDRRGRPYSGMEGRMLVAGVDPFGTSPYRYTQVAGRRVIFGFELMLEQNWARDRGYEVGDRISVATPTGRKRFEVVGVFKFTSGLSFGGQGLAFMPLREARRVMSIPYGWQQLSVSLKDGADVELAHREIQRTVGRGVDVKTPAGVSDDIKEQLGAMNVVLYFFSGVALFVGGFLIANSFNMTVLQRIRELGMLRTLGASRAMIARTVVTEALVIGVFGTIVGLGLGIALAAGLIEMMRGIGVPVGTLRVGMSSAITAAILGIVVTGLAALWPARRAGRVPPIVAALGGMQQRGRPTWRRGAIGLILWIPGMVVGGELWFGGGNSGSGLLAVGITIVMFAGMTMTAPFVILPLVRALAWPFRKFAPANGRLAADAVLANPQRTAATAAALMIGLSVVVVNSSMSTSFIDSVRHQVDANFARDFNVQATGFTLEEGGGPGVPRALATAIKATPEAETVTPVRSTLIHLPGTAGSAANGLALGIEPEVYGRVDKTPVAGVDRATALAEVANGRVLLGALYARSRGLERGDTIVLSGAAGSRRVAVAGVLESADFTGNSVQMSLAALDRIYGINTDAQLAVRARDARSRTVLERKLAALIGRRYPNLELQSAAAKKKEIEDEISAQFNMFNAMVAIAVIVSILGVVNTLAMSVLERTREIGVLRALGSSRRQVRLTMLDESLLITLAGASAGVLTGLLIGWFWVRSLDVFLPGIAFSLPVAVLIAIAALAVLAGIAAALIPARRAAHLRVINALTYE